MKRIIEGRWDCSYCDTKGILGRQQQCPNCGKVRGKDFKPYLPEDIESNYLSEEAAEKINKKPDWLCDYCGGYCSDNDTVCPSCGAPRTTSNLDYFDIQEQDNAKKEKNVVKGNSEENLLEEDNYENNDSSSFLKHNFLSIIKKPIFSFSLIGICIFLFLSGLIYLLIPKEVDMNVSELSWSRSIDIERYQTVQESDWSLPSEARLRYTAEEIHHYNQVLDHYDTKTRQVAKQRISGYETYTTTKDLGNGYFEEETHERPVYETYYEDEEYQEPVYKDVPVYQTKYYYDIDKWLYERSVKTSGSDKSPYWGDVLLNDDERISRKSSTYKVTGTVKKGKKKSYTLTYDEWKTLEIGQTVKLKVSLDNAKLIK